MKNQHSSPTVKPGQTYAGVVIELPEPMGSELQDWRVSFGDPAAGSVPAHITLMISPRLGPWDEFVARVRSVVSGWAPFHVELNGTGTFRPVTPVVYLRIDRGREDCLALHNGLGQAQLVSASPFEYHPHITLAHGVSQDHLDRAQQALRTYRASFLVDHVDLYEGDENSQWHVRERIAFAGHEQP